MPRPATGGTEFGEHAISKPRRPRCRSSLWTRVPARAASPPDPLRGCGALDPPAVGVGPVSPVVAKPADLHAEDAKALLCRRGLLSHFSPRGTFVELMLFPDSARAKRQNAKGKREEKKLRL